MRADPSPPSQLPCLRRESRFASLAPGRHGERESMRAGCAGAPPILTHTNPPSTHTSSPRLKDPFCRSRPESQKTAPSGDFLHTPHLQVPIPGILQADIWLRSLPTWCERQHGTLAMFTKALSALAILLSTVCGAVAVTKHEGTAANHEPAIKASRQDSRGKAGFVIGNMLFVGFHEMGHAVADQFHLPTLGRAEDAADSFAAIALLNAASQVSINMLVQAARGLFLPDRRDRKQGEELVFSNAHGLDKHRAFQIICLMVGSDKEQFKELADWGRRPQDRPRSCAPDYPDAT